MNDEAYALVTGASKGIGRAIAVELAGRGHNLLLVARSATLLAQLRDELGEKFQVQVAIFAADLTDPSVPAALCAWCREYNYPVDILVNNAGFGVWEAFEKADLQTLEEMNALNVSAVLRMCHVFLPDLKSRSRAHIMNVGSTGAYLPLPNMALYGAGKAYIRSFTWALRDELRQSSVTVTCLNPGGVWSEFTERAGSDVVAERQKSFIMSAEKCARIAVKAMLKGKTEVIPGWYNRLSAWATKHMPTSVGVAVGRKVFRKD